MLNQTSEFYADSRPDPARLGIGLGLHFYALASWNHTLDFAEEVKRRREIPTNLAMAHVQNMRREDIHTNQSSGELSKGHGCTTGKP